MSWKSIILTGTALLFLAACQTDSTVTNEAITYKRTSDTVIVRMESEPDRLTPLMTTSSYARRVFRQSFFPLEGYDFKTKQYESLLLSKPPQITDITDGPFAGGVAYTLELHPEAVWDNGTPVTGNDYLFTLKAVFNPLVTARAPLYRAFFSRIKAVEIDEENPKKFTVIVGIKDIINREIVTGEIPILPEYHYDANGLMRGFSLESLQDPDQLEQLKTDPKIIAFADFFNAPTTSSVPENIVGCGPYSLTEWVPGERITMVKKENWWGDALAGQFPQLQAYPQSLIFVPIPNPATALQALRAEEIDVMRNINAQTFQELRDENSIGETFNLYTPRIMSYFFDSVNIIVSKLSDKRVRQALAHAINTKEIIDNLYSGMGDQIASPVYRELPYYNDNLSPVAFDLDRARTLLVEAGWKDTNDNGVVDNMINGELTDLSLRYNYVSSSETSKNIALLIQDNAQRVGIEIIPNPVEPRMSIQLLVAKDYELGSAGSTVTATWNPKQSWHSSGDNRTGFGNAKTDALIDKIAVTLDEEERFDMYRELQEIIYDEMVQIFLFAPKERLAIHKRFAAETTVEVPGYNPRFFQLTLNQ